MAAGWNYPNKTGITLFMIGALIGYLIFVGAFFQDTEALVFSASSSGDEVLRSMRCPEMITNGETGMIEVTITNNSDKRLYRYVRTDISQGFLTMKREINESFYMDPGESKTLTWEVSDDDAAWGYVILVKVFVFKQNPHPSMLGTCGIASLDIPFLRGWQLIIIAAAVSMGIMGIGYWKYVKANQPLTRKKRSLAVNMKVIAVTVMLAMGSMLLEIWYMELVFFIFTIILLAESTFKFSQN